MWARLADSLSGPKAGTLSLGVSHLVAVLTISFSVILLAVLVRHPLMFFKRHGRRHGITGLLFLAVLALGFADAACGCLRSAGAGDRALVIFDVCMSALGIVLALSAAADFPHKNVVNVASGTLDEHATVTRGEMIEHAFYQGLNLAQIAALHAITPDRALGTRLALALGAAAPWLVRDRFPIHRFSANYTRHDARSSTLVRVLYRIKKYQYVFLKHFLQFGLNISLALSGVALARQDAFRVYWLLLNASFTLEFFLQTLVKKGLLRQRTMLGMQHLLMLASTLVAVQVLRHVNPLIALASLALNFTWPRHDFAITVLLVAVFAAPLATA